MTEIMKESMERVYPPELTLVERHIVDGHVDINNLQEEIRFIITDDEMSHELRHYAFARKVEVGKHKAMFPEYNEIEWHRRADETIYARAKERRLQVRTGEEISYTLHQTKSIDTLESVLKLFTPIGVYGPPEHLYYANFSARNFPIFYENFAEKIGIANTKELGERVGTLLAQRSSYGWKAYARAKMTNTAKSVLQVPDKETFRAMVENPTFEAKLQEEGDAKKQAYYEYLKAIGFDIIPESAPVTQLYDKLMATGRVVREDTFRAEVLKMIESEDVYENFVDKYSAEKLMALGLDLFKIATEQAAPFAQNANAISEFMKRQMQAKNFSYTHLITLANQLGISLNTNNILPKGVELSVLDEKNIGELPIAMSRLHYVITETGRNNMSDELTVMLEETIGLAKIMAASGAKKKSEERPMSIGDVVLEFPGKSAKELQDIIELLEAGYDISNVHERYRLHNQRTGGRAFWHKFQPGYGIIS